MILSIKHKFIFIHIPKTGGESVTQKIRWHTTKNVNKKTYKILFIGGKAMELFSSYISNNIK